MPLFSIHSWNDDQSVNEPWMYPEITPHIRDLIKFRYRLIPYLYALLWRSHRYYEPIIRPTFHDFPEDEGCYVENDDMLLGKNLLVAAVVEPGVRMRSVYLPEGCGWYDFWTGDYYHGGQQIILPAPWDRTPLLAKEGCAIPLNVAEQHFAKADDQRGFCLFPPRSEGEFEYDCFEDDGESEAYKEGGFWTWSLHLNQSVSELVIQLERSGMGYPEAGQIVVLLPRQEARRIVLRGGSVVRETMNGTNRKLLVTLT